MSRRITVRRRYRVLALLVLASALYWLAVWAWVQAGFARAGARGELPVMAELHAVGLVYQATWAWVVGGAALHLGAGILALARRDRELGVGVGWSAAFHLAFALTWGVVRL